MEYQKINSELRTERDRLTNICDELRAAMRSGNKTATDAFNREYPKLLLINRQIESIVERNTLYLKI